MLSSRTTALLVRTVYAGFIIYAAVLGDHAAVIFNSAVFLGTLVIWFVRDERALWYDALLVSLFAATLGAGFFGYELASSVLGPDKAFHFLAGVALAGIAWYAAPQFVREGREQLAFVVLFCAVMFLGWEVYEWLHFELWQNKNIITLLDTWLDLVADTLGALLVLWLAKR